MFNKIIMSTIIKSNATRDHLMDSINYTKAKKKLQKNLTTKLETGNINLSRHTKKNYLKME